MDFFQELISEEVWDFKYRYRYRHKIIDTTIKDSWLRVAKTAASAEKTNLQPFWQKKFYDILENFRFLPGGRILAGAGTKNKVTLFNCFVMDIQEDSLAGIFDALKEGALTLQQGGGVGYDFSMLRPRDELVKKTGLLSSGPVSFMRIWNTMCSVLLSTGNRRGAMMAIMRCDHPDIEEFISAKSDPLELRHFNVSVFVSDAFMQAVKENSEWELVFPILDVDPSQYKISDVVQREWGADRAKVACRIHKRINARDLWNKIIKSAYDYAEPGVLFEDTINRMNNLYYRERIVATNPCGEIPLPPYGACNLGAINLTQFVLNPFAENAELDWVAIKETAGCATRFLDNIIDVSRYPLKVQKAEALGARRIGLGLTGLADVFAMLGLRYGDEASLLLSSRIMKTIADATWETSIQLAKEKGSFPLYKKENYLSGQFVKTLSKELQGAIAKHGIRNSHHNTIAPTGTISILANNVSSGIEPVFGVSYDRYVLSPVGERKKFFVTDYAVHLWQKMHNTKTLPPAWTDSQDLLPEDHLKIQGAIQPYIDNAISKTINLPENFPFAKLNDVYTQAYELGLKGCTIYRPNSITGSVLSVADPEEIVEPCCQLS